VSTTEEARPAVEPSIAQVNANAPTAAPTTATSPAPIQEVRRTSPWLALQHRDFRLYWGGNFVSMAGSQMQIVAINVQLWDLTHDPIAVGLRGLLKLVPVLLLSLLGGVIADALDRRKMIVITQAIFAIVSVILAVSTFMGWATPLLLYAMTVIAAATIAFDNPARASMIPNLVPRAHLPNALSLNIIVWQVAMIVGPVVAGYLLPIGSNGIALIYAVDAVSFGAVLIAVLLMRMRFQTSETRDVSLKAAVDGFRFLRRTPIIMSTMTLDFFATFFGAAMMLLPAIAENVLHLDRSYLGWLYAGPAIGAVVAGAIMSWLGNVRNQGKIVLWSITGYGVATIVFGLSQNFWLTLLALAGTGAADTVSMVMRQTIRQMSTPDALRGRMTSINMVFYMGGPQLGEFEAGVAAAVLGLGPSVVLGGVLVIALTAITGIFAPQLRAYDRDTSHEVG
jgi:MFS family permease